MDLIRFLDSRLGEPSTWAGIAAMLGAAHVSVDPGVWAQITMWGMAGAGALAAVLAEAGKKPAAQIAADAVQALASGVKTATPPQQ